MNLKTVFRVVLILTIVLALAGVVVEVSLKSLLPQVLQDYLLSEKKSDLAPNEIPVLLAGLPAFVALIISYVGLFLWKSWGRFLFLAVWVLSNLISPFLGPYVLSGWAYTLYDMTTLLAGFLLGLAFFSPVAECFRAKKEERDLPPPLG